MAMPRNALSLGGVGHVEANDLWIEDRNFCTLGFIFGIAERRRLSSWYANTKACRGRV